MAVPTGTVQSVALNRIRERLPDMIDMLEAYETPFYSRIGTGDAKVSDPNWMTDEVAPPDTTNFVIEGDDAINDNAGQPVRIKNHCQLMDKTFQVSDTAQAVNTAGPKEKARQLLKMGIQLRTDIETFMTGNYASVAKTSTVPGRMASAEAMIATNVSGGVGYASGGYNTGTGLTAASTDGTARAFTETLFKNVVRDTWVKGGKNLNALLGPTQKQTASGFAGIATRNQQVVGVEQAKILGAADIYISDFGSHRLEVSRFNRNRTALVLDYTTWEKLWLQPISEKPLAVNGHSDRSMIKCELTLKCTNEKANGKVADLT
jgi:Family of unknown function (DUF5309)